MRRIIILCVLAAALLLPGVAAGETVRTSARAAVVIDAQSGQVLLEYNAHEPLPMASTTKVMTALLAMERGNMNDPVTCSHKAFGVPGTSIYLSEGETLTLEEMLYGLMLASGNDAAVAIAEHIGGSVDEFCRMMTERAAALGCEHTVFLTPHGLPQEGHYTTAHDLALIAREAMQQPLFRQIVSTTRATIPWEGRSYDRVLNNKNRLLTNYPSATGIKTGYTRAAGRCLVFGAQRNGMELIGVVLNCSDWFDEASRLMDAAFAKWRSVTMLYAGDLIRAMPVSDSRCDYINGILASDLRATVPINASPTVCIDLPDTLQAPVHAGDMLGTASLEWNGEVIASVPIIASDDAPLDTFRTRLEHCIEFWCICQ